MRDAREFPYTFRIKESMNCAGYGVHVLHITASDKVSVLKPLKLEWEVLGEGAVYFGDKPESFMIPYEALHKDRVIDALVAGLVDSGLHKSDRELSGELKAVKEHMIDLSQLFRISLGRNER